MTTTKKKEKKSPDDHSRARIPAKQVYVRKTVRDPKLCACDSYLHEAHHHCEGCGFVIHHDRRVCGDGICDVTGES